MERYLGIDIGGTNIKYGLFNRRAERIQTEYENTFSTPRNDLKKLLEIIHNIIENELPVSGIGLSVPGIMNEEGVIIDGGSIQCLSGCDLREILKDIYCIPVVIENDAHAFALAEKKFGEARTISNYFSLTIGTGLGGALYINDKLYKGSHDFSGEVSYLKVNGQYWSRIASMSALVREISLYKNKPRREIDGYQIMKWAQEDINIYNIYNSWLDALCEGIYNICVLFDPETIFVGGGISENQQFMSDLKRKFANYNPLSTQWNLERSAFGNDGGFTGAIVSLFLKLGILE